MSALASVSVLAGAAFMFVAALGVARLPDLYTRMQAATKASTVGVMGVMLGVAIAFWDAEITIRSLLVGGFFLLTSPVAAHAIARSAHTREVPLAPGTRVERLGEEGGRPPRPPEGADAAARPAAQDGQASSTTRAEGAPARP